MVVAGGEEENRMADLTGKTLGKYRLVERLGRGGMAEVYKAYQPGLDRYVAVKLMHAYLAEDGDFVDRFHREAKAIAALRHPHIVQAHDFDAEGDVYYMIQEYIKGGTLKALLREARERGETISLEETVRILKAICGAIDYAHAQGCIHRDVKPDNIMFDANGRPVLTDFGIAAIAGGTRLTATGAMIGTPAYMSPEQGKGDPNDPRSDIYSLGVVLYEMVTGRVPFDADTPFAVVLKHLNEPLPLPRTLNPQVSPSVERVILKALAKDPDDRYQTAGTLAQALDDAASDAELPEWDVPLTPQVTLSAQEELLKDEMAPAQGPPMDSAPQPAQVASAIPAPEPARRRRLWPWALAGGAVLLLILAIIAGAALLDWGDEPDGGQPTRTAAAARFSREAAQGTNSEVAALIQAGNEILHAECDGDIEEAMSLFERAIEQDESSAEAYVGRARCRACYEEYKAAMDDLDRAIELDPTSALVYYWRGRLWMNEEREQEALADLTRAIELDPMHTEAYYWRGLLLMWTMEDTEQALADLNKVIELDPDYAMAYLYRGQLYWGHRDNADAALADYSRFVELEPDSPEGYAGRGEIYLYPLEDYEKAVAEYTLAIERDPDYAYFYVQRAWAYSQQERLDLAIEDFTRALEAYPDAQTYFYRGVTNHNAERYKAALDDFDMVLLLDWEGKGGAYYGRGRTYYALEQYADAIEAYSQAAEHNWEEYIWPYFGDTHLLLDRAMAYRESGQFGDALDDLNKLIAEADGWFLPYYERAMTYKAMGEDERALADLRQAWEYVEDAESRTRIEEEMQALRQ
jgi:tetratricopeptide (TPR) repeat protein/tRNA A-37 threonylcarbamoyl transferase component Bud32